jgi:putative endonuclease
MEYSVYILESEKNGRYYVGATRDLASRITEHNLGLSPSTKDRGPWKLVYEESFPSLSEARFRERQLKKRKSKIYLQSLIAQHNGT